MVFLAPFIAPIIASLGWIARIAVPALLSSFFAALLYRVAVFVAFYFAMNTAVEYLTSMGSSYLGGLPAEVIQMMQLTGLINAMNIILSAYLFKLTMKIDTVKLAASSS